MQFLAYIIKYAVVHLPLCIAAETGWAYLTSKAKGEPLSEKSPKCKTFNQATYKNKLKQCLQ